MAEVIRLADPHKMLSNPENPRLIFHADELQALQDSIKSQGILVPLTVYEDESKLYILDGERRWRSALKLGLPRVPVIVQPKPDRLTNIMMMFAIHHARQAWDPLPTAYKLRELEEEFRVRQDRQPTESELAGLASVSRGEVRRLKNLLRLPVEYRDELMAELKKPRAEQVITVDHVLETTKGASSLRKRGVVDAEGEDELRRAVLAKFRSRVEVNTVAPRQLARIARAVEREEVSVPVARHVVSKLVADDSYSIEHAFRDSVELVDFEHGTEQIARRLTTRLDEHLRQRQPVGAHLRETLSRLDDVLKRLLTP